MSSARARSILAIAAAALGALAPCSARAAACCVSATSFGIGRLIVWEDAAAGVLLGHARLVGQYDARGKWRRNPPTYAEGVSTIEPYAIVRVLPRLQLQAWAPFLVNDRRVGRQSQVAGGLGDVGGAARVELVSMGQWAGVPAVAVIAGVLAPTGRRVEQTRPPLFAGATGRGAWGGSIGLEIESTWLPWFAKLEAGATAFLPFRRPDTGLSQRYGRLVQAALSGGRELVPDVLVAAASLQAEWEDAIRIDGVTQTGSGARQLALALSLSWRATAAWTFTGTGTNTVWPSGAAANRDGRAGFTLGVRRGF